MRRSTGANGKSARSSGSTCSRIISSSSRGTPGMTKKRQAPIDSAKPSAVPIGLASSRAPWGEPAGSLFPPALGRRERRHFSSSRLSGPAHHQLELPRDAGHDEDTTRADRQREACRRTDRVGEQPGTAGEVGWLFVRFGDGAAEAAELLLEPGQRSLVPDERYPRRP